MKIVKIDKEIELCAECDHSRKIKNTRYCFNPDMGKPKEIGTDIQLLRIPSWCLLPDAETTPRGR